MNDYLDFAQNLQTKITGSVLTDAPMSDYTTWKIGGNADVLAIPQNPAELAAILTMATEAKIPLMIIGKGSDLLVSDSGIRGLVVQIGEKLNNIEWLAESKVMVQAGVSMSSLAWECAKRNLSGLEWAVGIPGNLGGALIMNAGAYGSNISSCVTKIEVMEYNGKRKWLNRDELQFGYRHGFTAGTSVVINIELQLTEGDRTVSELHMRQILQTRTKNQPLEYPSAGSVFKNPEGDHAEGYSNG